MSDLDIAEIFYETGALRFRYARFMSEDGTRWIRHGLFRACHPNGTLASEGYYVDGREHGAWRDYHENGRLAAEGCFESGRQVGEWRYWDTGDS